MVGGSCLLLWTLFVLVNTESSSKSSVKVTAKSGENATLECHTSKDAAIKEQAWRKYGMWEAYVFFLIERRPYEDFQLPSFRGRVELRDPEMKNGDFSVILKNVTVNDTGTYQCVVRTQSRSVIRFINLEVTESGHTAGNTEETGVEEGGDKERRTLTVALVTAAVVICVVCGLVGFVLWKRQRSQQQNSDPPPAADDELQPL